MPERFAIYFAPSPESVLWERAAQWLGRDAASGELLGGTVAGLDRSRLLNLTQDASRYGFHATLKAPMALLPELKAEDLREAMRRFARARPPLDLGRPRIENIGGFLAMVVEPSEALSDLAADVVEAFEPFRAPMSLRERERRIANGLSDRQIELLDAYGYRYVFDQFQFHMTLTDRLDVAEQREISQAAATWFAPVLDEPVVLDRLSLFHEPDSGKPFRRLADFRLGECR